MKKENNIIGFLKEFIWPTKWKVILTVSLFIIAKISIYIFNKCLGRATDISFNICGPLGIIVSILIILYLIPIAILDEILGGFFLFERLTTITNFVFMDILIILFYYIFLSIIFSIISLMKKMRLRK